MLLGYLGQIFLVPMCNSLQEYVFLSYFQKIYLNGPLVKCVPKDDD